MSKEISLIAATVYGNRGAEAMLCTVIGILRERDPELRFNVFSYYPKEDCARISANHVTVYSATPAAVALRLFPFSVLFGLLRLVAGRRAFSLAPAPIKALARSSALVDLAGVSFIAGREKFLPYNVLTLLPAMLLATPVVKMAQAIGPLRGTANRFAAKFVLPRCRKIWARGAQTYANLQKSGLAGLDFALGDDVAFNYSPEWSLSTERPATFDAAMGDMAARRNGYRGVIGLCPSSVVAVTARRTGVPYEPVMAGLVEALVADGYLVVLFPNATRDESGEKQRNNDLPLIRRIRAECKAAAVPGDAVVAFDMDINTACIKQVIAALDVAMVSRFHAMVGALSLAVPVTVLGWSHKYLEVMARFGLESLVLDYAKSSVQALVAKVTDAFESRQAIRAQIAAALPAVKEAALEPVLDLLKEGG